MISLLSGKIWKLDLKRENYNATEIRKCNHQHNASFYAVELPRPNKNDPWMVGLCLWAHRLGHIIVQEFDKINRVFFALFFPIYLNKKEQNTYYPLKFNSVANHPLNFKILQNNSLKLTLATNHSLSFKVVQITLQTFQT